MLSSNLFLSKGWESGASFLEAQDKAKQVLRALFGRVLFLNHIFSNACHKGKQFKAIKVGHYFYFQNFFLCFWINKGNIIFITKVGRNQHKHRPSKEESSYSLSYFSLSLFELFFKLSLLIIFITLEIPFSLLLTNYNQFLSLNHFLYHFCVVVASFGYFV